MESPSELGSVVTGMDIPPPPPVPSDSGFPFDSYPPEARDPVALEEHLGRKRTTDDHNTPESFLQSLVYPMTADGTVDLDPCSNQWSVVKDHLRFGLDFGLDGLVMEWLSSHGVVYVNPRYSKMKPWVEKCIEEHIKNPRQDILLLGKCDPAVNWYRLADDHAVAAAEPYKRIRFERGTDDDNGANFSSTLFYWGERLTAFLRMCHGLAKPRVGHAAFYRLEDICHVCESDPSEYPEGHPSRTRTICLGEP